jgi:hypothetical protein
MTIDLQLDGGFHAGPLFVYRKKRPAKRDIYKSGWLRRQAEYKAAPPWVDRTPINAIYRECKRLNRRDGACTWAVDHIVPLNHPLVCGLHIAVNLQISKYNENALKSNNWWPDMWGEQIDLF